MNDNIPSSSPLDKNDGGKTQNRGLTNGFGADESNRSNRSRENIHSDKRFEEKQRYDRQNNEIDRPNRFSDKRNSRFADVQNDRSNKHSDRGRHNSDRSSGNRQNVQGQSEGQRNIFEERKSKYLTNKQNRTETESEEFWDTTEQKEKNQNVSQLSTKDNDQPNFCRSKKTEDLFNQVMCILT